MGEPLHDAPEIDIYGPQVDEEFVSFFSPVFALVAIQCTEDMVDRALYIGSSLSGMPGIVLNLLAQEVVVDLFSQEVPIVPLAYLDAVFLFVAFGSNGFVHLTCGQMGHAQLFALLDPFKCILNTLALNGRAVPLGGSSLL